MYRSIFMTLVLMGACIFSANAQQDSARPIPADELEKVEQGEVVEFEKTLRRLEVAFKEGDVKSANKIKSLLETAMQKRIERVEKTNVEAQVANLEKQQEILNTVKVFEFTGLKENYRNELAHVQKLQQFAQLMKQ